MQNNAKDQLQIACNQLSSAQSSLNQAISTVEKLNNKEEIEKALTAVSNAVSVANSSYQNYKD
ncbi:MAG: hypothetical protein HUJ77_11390 [Clostridium sp.]|uniref:hypothetical protein n=1 Tax=Clostridium sp. TaxID=1506 RepID=UPI0025C538A2|nr:hypothetical protein [Clostridium sp.]MCF0148986.1 hypothetical protein [Clostridium sp.]